MDKQPQPEKPRKGPSRIDLLELDIDTRMAYLWEEAFAVEKWDIALVGAYMRAAYGKGYCDAIAESTEEHGRLAIDHGYSLPKSRPLPPGHEV